MKRILSILISSFLLSSAVNAQLAGAALHFDGVDDYISCPLPSIFTNIGSNDFTVELWASPTVGTFERLFFAQKDISNFATISLTSAGEIVFYLEENGVNHSVQSSSTMNPLEWAHIAVTWDAATQEAKIFLNGDEAVYLPGVYVSSTGTDAKMTMGSKSDGTQNFNGMVDELYIWSVAKSECEISFEMNNKKLGSEPNIIASYIFDAGTPGGSNPGEVILSDLSGSTYDGDLMNFALNGSTSNWILSYANIIRLWGTESQAFLGQLGLVSTINADYFQWIYCDDNLPVPGATDVIFDPASQDPNYTGINDSYAVISTTGNCADTSECFVVNTNVGVNENDLDSYVSIFPNPSQGIVSIESSITIDLIEILSVSGEITQIIHPNSAEKLQFELAQENGFYLIVLHTSVGLLTKKILVHNN